MIEILQNKNSATRFQIMVEIAASGPNIHQSKIAAKLGITPQAVSEYIRKLLYDGMIISNGRFSYRVSTMGVNWILKMLREMRDYEALVTKAVTNITVCAAIAESDLTAGQTVGLKMKDGILLATREANSGAKGITVSSARQGEDVDITKIEGLVELPKGRVTVLQVPVIEKGGSRQTDLSQLKNYINNAIGQQVGAIGIEALATLRQINVEPRYFYGVSEAAVEAARCGLSFAVVCTADFVAGLVKRLQEEKLDYQVIDLARQAA
ncbi:MAG: winged helix-turn-helix transcriptional regulator [Chloroflexi bacterium]|nr:winged helix-turn-helix transcriptional regulator [Chloroflexota bacterium]